MAYLSFVDYIVFSLFLLFSASVGIYHGVRSRTRQSTSDYLLASRTMHPLPVGISIAVSLLSAVSYLGTPAEIYVHGPVFWLCFAGNLIEMVIVASSFCPIYYELKITSVYEYLDLRFGKHVRSCGAAINLLYLFLYMGIVIYAPSLALNAVTGLSLQVSIISVGVVCTFYTTVGGIRAVVWTDLFQSFLFIAGTVITIIACTVHVGGLGEVFRINIRDGRDRFFDFRLDPTIRHTTWSVIIGIGVLHTAYFSTNQIIVQRFMACRTLFGAKVALYIGSILASLILILLCLDGICLYAFFAGCDPVTEGKVQKADQLMAYVIMEIFRDAPGMGGLLISAVFSASLSTISSGINALTALISQDVLGTFLPGLSDLKRSVLLRIASVLLGILTIILAFLASSMGGLLTMTLSLAGVLNGPVFGVFCLGIFIPWANSKGASIGLFIGAAIGMWITIGARVYPPVLSDPPLFVDQCMTNLTNQTAALLLATSKPLTPSHSTELIIPIIDMKSSTPAIASFYSLSYTYYSLISCVTTIIVGVICSFLTHPTDPRSIDSKLLSPWARKIAMWGFTQKPLGDRKQKKGMKNIDTEIERDDSEHLKLEVREN